MFRREANNPCHSSHTWWCGMVKNSWWILLWFKAIHLKRWSPTHNRHCCQRTHVRPKEEVYLCWNGFPTRLVVGVNWSNESGSEETCAESVITVYQWWLVHEWWVFCLLWRHHWLDDYWSWISQTRIWLYPDNRMAHWPFWAFLSTGWTLLPNGIQRLVLLSYWLPR